jgi:2-ketocyclohexanecarboxyl-CoA hydrolase
MKYEDILYRADRGVAHIIINRPQVMNAFRGQTCEELINALNKAGWDKSIGVIVLGGAGEKAFCTGGDQSAHDGQYDRRGIIGLPVEELQSLIRDLPKPVIARVQGTRSVAATCSRPRDLVSLPPLHRGGSLSDGAGQRRRAAR